MEKIFETEAKNAARQSSRLYFFFHCSIKDTISARWDDARVFFTCLDSVPTGEVLAQFIFGGYIPDQFTPENRIEIRQKLIEWNRKRILEKERMESCNLI